MESGPKGEDSKERLLTLKEGSSHWGTTGTPTPVFTVYYSPYSTIVVETSHSICEDGCYVLVNDHPVIVDTVCHIPLTIL